MIIGASFVGKKTTADIFVQCKEFQVLNYFTPPVEDKDINLFWWKLRDPANYIDSLFNPNQNLSNKDKGDLQK